MSTIGELFAPQFLHGGPLTAEVAGRHGRRSSGADSLRYLPVESIARAIGFDADQLCQACITGDYPTPCGQELYQIALSNARSNVPERTYESAQRREGSKQWPRASGQSPVVASRTLAAALNE